MERRGMQSWAALIALQLRFVGVLLLWQIAECLSMHVPLALQVNEGLADTPTEKLEYSLRQVSVSCKGKGGLSSLPPRTRSHQCCSSCVDSCLLHLPYTRSL